MIKELILYVIYSKPLYGYGMVFDLLGVFRYAVDPIDVKNIKKNGLELYYVIDPKGITLLDKDFDEKSALIITSFFGQLFRENSSVMDSKPYFNDLVSKILLDYDFNSKKILDYGSGYDTYSEYFPNSEYFGYDLNRGEEIDGYKNENFDYVLCFFVLEHVSSIEKSITQISKKLRSKGVCIIIIPSLSFLDFIKFYVIKSKMELPIFHYRTFGYKNFPGCVSFRYLKRIFERCNIKQKNIAGILRFNNKNFHVGLWPFCYFCNQTIIIGEKV